MTQVADRLLTSDTADRVHYETGVLLNDEDFITEQNYHRGRLARALEYFMGSGTAAGLRVVHEEAVAADDSTGAREEQLLVAPGLAVDGRGRMIELTRHHCLRLNRWYQGQSDGLLIQGWHGPGVAWPDAPAGVTVDIGIAFTNCEKGKTPSFAVGPFDSIDAVTAARIQEGAAIGLQIRTEASPPLPENPWPDFSAMADSEAAATAMREAILDAWQTTDTDLAGAQGGLPQQVFLARMVIESDEPLGDNAPVRTIENGVQLNNSLRPFLLSTAALARWLNINLASSV